MTYCLIPCRVLCFGAQQMAVVGDSSCLSHCASHCQLQCYSRSCIYDIGALCASHLARHLLHVPSQPSTQQPYSKLATFGVATRVYVSSMEPPMRTPLLVTDKQQ